MKIENTRKPVFLTDTPIQILNSINLCFSYELEGKPDLYIVKMFETAEDIASKIRETDIFNNVYVVERERRGALKHLWTLFGLFLPRLYTKKIMHVDAVDRYDSIFTSTPNKLFDYVIASNREKTVYGFEDGMGSYVSNIYKDPWRKKYRLAKKLMGNDWKVKQLFLYHPDYCLIDYGCEILPLNFSNNTQQIRTLEKIFSYRHSELYTTYRTVYLNQPNEGNTAAIDIEKRVLNKLKQSYKDRFIVRLHPRETNTTIYEGLPLDSENNNWELLCNQQISDEHILISKFSTAQFIPKFLYDIEPKIIFMFPLFEIENAVFDEMIHLLKRVYRDPSKVCVIHNLDEFEEVLK